MNYELSIIINQLKCKMDIIIFPIIWMKRVRPAPILSFADFQMMLASAISSHLLA